MNSIPSPLFFNTTPDSPAGAHTKKTSLATKAIAIFFAVLLATGGALAGATPLHRGALARATPLNLRRLQGGSEIATPDASSLRPPTRQHGPFYSQEMRCHLASMPIINVCDLEEAPLFAPAGISLIQTHSHPALNAYAEIVAQEIPELMIPYVEAVEQLTPSRDVAATEFPANMEAFMNNGLFLVGNGNRSCVINEDFGLADYPRCHTLTDLVVKEIATDHMESQVYTDEAFRTKGFQVMVPAGAIAEKKIEVSLGLNPKNAANYRRVLQRVTTQVLQSPCFFNKEPVDILDFLKSLHKILLKGIPANNLITDSRLYPGEYRRDEIVVFHDPNIEGTDLESLVEHLRSKGATKKELKSFTKAFGKLAKLDPNTPLSEAMTDQEIKSLQEIWFLPPSPSKISTLMLKFVNQLKTFIAQDIHPVALAAWAHCELGRIHPFTDGNGRMARILMNTLLIRGGYEPVIIPNDTLYTAALNADYMDDPGAFASYVAGLIQEQSKGPQVLMGPE
ncbi:MAG: Fic family protein [Parachlamydiaceae bacterium]